MGLGNDVIVVVHYGRFYQVGGEINVNNDMLECLRATSREIQSLQWTDCDKGIYRDKQLKKEVGGGGTSNVNLLPPITPPNVFSSLVSGLSALRAEPPITTPNVFSSLVSGVSA